MQIRTNDTNSTKSKIIYPDLSYVLVGIAFNVHNDLGRYAREKQYGDALERGLKENKIPYKRELRIGEEGNILDFLIDDKIVIEIKAKRMILKEDYFQTQRYLQSSNARLGLLINFRSKYLKPIRVVRIETDSKYKYV